MKMKNLTWKKVALSLACGLLGVCVLLVGAWCLPFPIEGNWMKPWIITCMCKNEFGCYDFLRFENGKIIWMSNTHFPPCWRGTYKRKGWGKYEVEEFGSGLPPSIANSSFLHIKNALRCPFIFRDPSITICREAVNHPSNEWMRVSAGYTISAEKELFRGVSRPAP